MGIWLVAALAACVASATEQLASCVANPKVEGRCPPAGSPAAQAYRDFVGDGSGAVEPAAAAGPVERKLFRSVEGSPCPMFGDGRVSSSQWNLMNCSNHRPNSCCTQQDVMAAFSELAPSGLVRDCVYPTGVIWERKRVWRNAQKPIPLDAVGPRRRARRTLRRRD